MSRKPLKSLGSTPRGCSRSATPTEPSRPIGDRRLKGRGSWPAQRPGSPGRFAREELDRLDAHPLPAPTRRPAHPSWHSGTRSSPREPRRRTRGDVEQAHSKGGLANARSTTGQDRSQNIFPAVRMATRRSGSGFSGRRGRPGGSGASTQWSRRGAANRDIGDSIWFDGADQQIVRRGWELTRGIGPGRKLRSQFSRALAPSPCSSSTAAAGRRGAGPSTASRNSYELRCADDRKEVRRGGSRRLRGHVDSFHNERLPADTLRRGIPEHFQHLYRKRIPVIALPRSPALPANHG
jgi:hypothetical protein